MSKLYYQDQGFVIPTNCEEVAGLRRAVKYLSLPKTAYPAKLFFEARPRSMDAVPLHIAINRFEIPPVVPEGSIPAFRWYERTIPPEYLHEGLNSIELWTHSGVDHAWTLALDGTTPEISNSFVSVDGGVTWSDRQLGRFNRDRGSYLVRVRLEERQDPTPKAWIGEEFSHPRLAEIRAMLPNTVPNASTTLEKIRILSAWISQSWEYCSSLYSSLYTPWDAATILAWGSSKQGQNGQRPMVMCVHYSIVLITACQALGIHARGNAFTEAINSFNGHFAAEVWLPELQKWIFVDPNVDAIFFDKGIPLSIAEMHSYAGDLAPYVEFGPGFAYQMQNSAIQDFMNIYLNGRFMRLRGMWPRSDFLSHPERTPPGHGSLAYCETDFVWEPDEGLEMFPHFASSDYFNAAPGIQDAEQ